MTATAEPVLSVYLHPVRHGHTLYNELDVSTGQRDVPVSDRGRAQLEALAAELRDTPLDRIVHSDLSRCESTARAIAEASQSDPSVEASSMLRQRLSGTEQGRPKACGTEPVEPFERHDQVTERIGGATGSFLSEKESRLKSGELGQGKTWHEAWVFHHDSFRALDDWLSASQGPVSSYENGLVVYNDRGKLEEVPNASISRIRFDFDGDSWATEVELWGDDQHVKTMEATSKQEWEPLPSDFLDDEANWYQMKPGSQPDGNESSPGPGE